MREVTYRARFSVACVSLALSATKGWENRESKRRDDERDTRIRVQDPSPRIGQSCIHEKGKGKREKAGGRARNTPRVKTRTQNP